MDRLSEIKAAIEYALREDYSVNGIDVCKRLKDALKQLESLQSDQCAIEILIRDEDYDAIEQMATQRFRAYSGRVRGQTVTMCDGLDYWMIGATIDYFKLKESPAPPVSGTECNHEMMSIKGKPNELATIKCSDCGIPLDMNGNVVKPVARDEKLPGVYAPLTMSRNMKSRALAAGIDPERLSEAWISIINARPLAYQPLPQPPEES